MLRLLSGRGRKEVEVDTSDLQAEQAAKVEELRTAIGPLDGIAATFCTDDCLRRYLRARSWDVRKAERMLRNSIKWREEYKPQDITWGEVEHEGTTGKMFRLSRPDKKGRAVVVMKPGLQQTNDHDSQIRHLVYTLENACHYASELGGENIVWLIDFQRWSLRTSPPFKTSKATLDILQNQYPERLGLAILFNPPRLFSGFWKIIYPFIDPITREKVKFVYPNTPECERVMNEYFDMTQMEVAFGGCLPEGEYDHDKYGKMLMADDEKRSRVWKGETMQEHTQEETVAKGEGSVAEEAALRDTKPTLVSSNGAVVANGEATIEEQKKESGAPVVPNGSPVLGKVLANEVVAGQVVDSVGASAAGNEGASVVEVKAPTG